MPLRFLIAYPLALAVTPVAAVAAVRTLTEVRFSFWKSKFHISCHHIQEMESEHQNSESSKSLQVNNVPNLINPQVNTYSLEEHAEDGDAERPWDISNRIPNHKFFYRQDVVKCSNQEGMLGIIMEVPGDSISEVSMSDNNDSEDEEQNTVTGGNSDDSNKNDAVGSVDISLADDQVRIRWLHGSETRENTYDITVKDRSFFHGDIVASAYNPTGQLGLITDIDMRVDLLSTNGELIKDVSTRYIKHISEFNIGDVVIHGPWLGRVNEVFYNVDVLFNDRSVCKVVKADPLRLRPVSKSVADDADCPYYPGQRVRAISSSVFKTSRWLSGLWRVNRLDGTVLKVEIDSVMVYWISSAILGSGDDPGTPPREQNPKNLTLLSCFSHVNWQLSDWCLFQVPSHTLLSANDLNESIEGENSVSPHTYGHPTSFIDVSTLARDVCDTDFASCNASVKSDPLVSDALGLQINSENMPNGSTKTSTIKERTQESWPMPRRKLRKVFFKREKKARRKDENFEKAFLVASTVTKVNVAWQDGKTENWLPSTSLVPIQTPNDDEFFPEQYVVEKASSEGEGSKANRTGVVMFVNSQERTARVRWLKEVQGPEEALIFDTKEVVSAYDLEAHPDYDYCYGDVVFRLAPIFGNSTAENSAYARKERTDAVNMEDGSSGKDAHKDRVQNVSKGEACGNLTCLPWVGHITGLEEGNIEVSWLNGKASKVGPQEIYVVIRDGEPIIGVSEISDSGASWEMVEENEMNTLDVSEKEDDRKNLNGNTAHNINTISQEDNYARRSGPLTVSLAVLDFFTKLLTGIFNRGRKQLAPSGSDKIFSSNQDKHELDVESQSPIIENILSEENGSREPDATVDGSGENVSKAEVPEHGVAAMEFDMRAPDPLVKDGSIWEFHDFSNFKHFDITESTADHHFHGNGALNTGGRKWAKKIQQEWSILEHNLPDAIYVRVFEDRMDLLRAVIVGTYETPYQDGLFFFDFYFPTEFPQVPPTVHYHSCGLRINPNLYVDGNVCLSLLNTWTGRENEVWDPSSSSILQVMVSIQGLVLNSKPYFNEAGYEKQIGTLEGEKNFLPYNENTYLLNLKSMIYLLRRPPMHFEDFVKDHFRRRGHYILKACEAYYKGGCSVGSLTNDCHPAESSINHSCSIGFKLALAKILPRLIAALKEVGADCHQFEYLITPDNLPES